MSKSPAAERLLDAASGWRDEAQAVIADIQPMVNSISISSTLPCDSQGVYLNLETKEGRRYTVEMSTAGFRVCGHQPDVISTTPGDQQDDQKTYFETPYALLDSISPGYRFCFGTALAKKLEKLVTP